ncbi:MAG TPA: DUF3500 domain-containing protein [Cyclobacteriaceae bacterium]|nr:DUF3500 domain-containing protein [Cyclobacteriaceae bacterium]
MRTLCLSLCLITTFLSTHGQSNDCPKQGGISRVVCLAEAFKATLNKDQLTLVQLDYSKGDAVRWSNFPQAFARPSRIGLSLGSLNAAQFSAFKRLMNAVLSEGILNEGIDELEGALHADTYFGEKTGKTNVFGSNYYVIVFLGKPSTEQLWELMFGGHHFAFANTYFGGKLTGATPSFRGVEPLQPIHVKERSYEPLEDEKRAFAEILNSLSDEQKRSAKLSSASGDVLLGPGKDDEFPATKSGVRIGTLGKEAAQKIIKAVGLYVNDLDSVTAGGLMKKYIAEIADTYLSYTGSGTMAQTDDYIRLDGPNLWIEYSAQPSRDFPGTSHPHSVWRDRKTDYGGN